MQIGNSVSTNYIVEDGNGTVEKTDTGYTWKVAKLNGQDSVKMKFKLALKPNTDIDAGVIFEDTFTNKSQKITYNGKKELHGSDPTENTEATLIKICQGYDLKIKAVNDANTALTVEGIQLQVKGIDEKGQEVCSINKTTDSNGYITITPEDARALRADGTITYTVQPILNGIVGYSATDSVSFDIINDKVTRNLKYDNHGSELEIKINENARTAEVIVPINSKKADFELRLEELNNSNVTISGAEFELIQPKLNSKYDMNKLIGTTDENGIIHFSPTVMTKDGTYNYILVQNTTQMGYELTQISLIKITYKDGEITTDPEIYFNPDVKGELLKDKENHVLITVGNECTAKDPFDLQINLSDVDDTTIKLEGVTYLVTTTNANNQVRSEYVKTDVNGQINTKVYGNGYIIVRITEQTPKVGYLVDNKTKEIIINRVNGEVTVLRIDPTDLDVEQNGNKDNLQVNLYSKKKEEQNVVKVKLVDSEEQDVAVGAGIVYTLEDTETGTTYGPSVSDRNGELSFIIGTKGEGSHQYRLILDNNTIPTEYDKTENLGDITFNLIFDQGGYIIDKNTIDNKLVVKEYCSVVDNQQTKEYTAFIHIGYEMEKSNTIEFKVNLKEYEASTPIEGASYNLDIEWEVNGITRTKTIVGRKTNNSGELSTRIVKGNNLRINVTEVSASVGYTMDSTTQEIELQFLNNSNIKITQSPYDYTKADAKGKYQGAHETTTDVVVYEHLNRLRSTEDTYINLTVNKQDMNGAYVSGIPLLITSDTLQDKQQQQLKLVATTDVNGTVAIDYSQYLKDMINEETIRAPGIKTDSDEIVYYLNVSEAELVPQSSEYVEKAGTRVTLRLIFRYADGRVRLTNVETIYGNRLLVKSQNGGKIFSSSSDTAAGQQLENSLGIFLANITLDLYTNYDEIGNLSLDFKKINDINEELVGAKYNIKVTNPDGTVVRKEMEISNGQFSSDIEISGVNVNQDSIIELTEIEAPVGYEVNENTETLEVTSIAQDGTITLTHKDQSYSPSRLNLQQKASTNTASGNVKTNYEITFVDYQLDTFQFEITTKDSKDKSAVGGYGFKVDTSKGATKIITTSSSGVGSAKVGGSVESNQITYTISVNKVAEYYKPLSGLIHVIVEFDQFGNVDFAKTKAAQTDPGHGKIWDIIALEDQKIGIQILVDHQDPLVVKVKTLDKITEAPIQEVDYKVQPSMQLEAIGKTDIQVGYVLENGIKTYTITQTQIKDSYQMAEPKTFTITYQNEDVDSVTLEGQASGTTGKNDSIQKTGTREVTITIYVEPKVPFEIKDVYYFNETQGLQGASFEITSLRNNDTARGTTDAQGILGLYSDILGKQNNDKVMYKVRQTKAASGYATVEDFYVEVTYDQDRKIQDAKLVTEHGDDVSNNRFVKVGKRTSTLTEYNKNEQGVVTITIKHYPEFQILIKDLDRRNGTDPVAGTEYSVKSTYEQDNNVVDFTQTSGVVTDSTGLGTAHLDRTKDDTTVTYVVKETSPATDYQTLGTDIEIEVEFDSSGYVKNVQVKNDTILNKIEHASLRSNINNQLNPEDHFRVDLELKNNPILQFNLTAQDSVNSNTKIKDIGFQIVSKQDGDEDTIYSNSANINKVNLTGTPQTSYTDGKGETQSYLDRTLDNEVMLYTIKEVQKSPGYEWNDTDIVIKVTYDNNGQISQTAIDKGNGFISIDSYNKNEFEINITILNDEIKEFGIHLTTEDTYDTSKRLNDIEVEAFLTEGNAYQSDGEYELIGDNSLKTGADRNQDGIPDITYGEDYESIGQYIEGAGERTLRLIVKNDASDKGGYYLDSTDNSKSGDNIGYYLGNQYFENAKYQAHSYCYIINVKFSDEGKIEEAKLVSGGLITGIGQWSANTDYVQTIGDTLNILHTDYKLNITMKFFPMFNLNVNAMDNYTYSSEIKTNIDQLPNVLPGAKYRISTSRHDLGIHPDEYVKAGYIGNSSYGGVIYEGIDEMFVPIEKGKSRLFFVFEENEPTNYQTYTDRYMTLYSQRLVAIISVTFNEKGEIDQQKTQSGERIDENGNITKPYLGEGGEILSSNNLQEYNYLAKFDSCGEAGNVSTKMKFYIGYALTTTLNVTAIDDISGNPISNIKMYPFENKQTYPINNNICVTNTSYEYNVYSYRYTNSQGKFSIKYWGAAHNANSNQYIIGSERQGNDYNGYLFPDDMASAQLGGNGDKKSYYAKIDVTYDANGKIASVTSLGKDLWGDNNAIDISWDSETGNVYVKMLYSRKFQMTLNKVDFYDSTINGLFATFNVTSDKGLTTTINAKKMTPMGKVYKNQTVKYTLSETETPDKYYPIGQNIDFNVTFDENGNIGKNTIKSKNEYFEVEMTTNDTEKINKTQPDLTINIKNKPAFCIDLKIIDKFYRSEGIPNINLSVTNSKNDKALGSPQTDKNGYAKIIIGPAYINETVTYEISQNSQAPGYYMNNTTVKLEVEFNEVGKIQRYSIIAGDDVVYQFSPDAYLNTREISMQIMNMPENLKIGLYKYDKIKDEPMAGIGFTITKTNISSMQTTNKTITTTQDGTIVENIDTFTKTNQGEVIKYTIHEDKTPETYRGMEDVEFLVRYNADGSIASFNQVPNAKGILNTKVDLEVAIGTMKTLNDQKVHFVAKIPNDNAFDIIIKNEDTNYSKLGIEDSIFDLSINGVEYQLEPTDENGQTSVTDITESGIIDIQVSQKTVGEGYRSDIANNTHIKLDKGITTYSLNLVTGTDGLVNDKQATTLKANVEVDEEYGTITITFKNETLTELTLIKQDKDKKETLEGIQFEVKARQVNDQGQSLNNERTLTVTGKDTTDANGEIYFDLGVAPKQEIWEYSFVEVSTPPEYQENGELVMTVRYDQYGRIISQESNKQSKLVPTLKNDNENCRNMYVVIYNEKIQEPEIGDDGQPIIPPPTYTVKVVTEDVDTGKRISGSSIYINMTDANGDLITVEPKTSASANNGTTSVTGNLGIDGSMYTDEQIEEGAPIIIEKGLTYIDNIDYEGTLNIDVSQQKTAEGYVFGDHTSGNVQVDVKYIPPVVQNGEPTLTFNVTQNAGFTVIADQTNRIITIKITNKSQVLFDITTQEYKTKAESETVYIQGVNYIITSEILSAINSEPTDLNETTQISDEKGKTQGNVGRAYAGQTILYTLHQNTPLGYKPIDDIQVEVTYDSRGYIKYYEVLSSEDNCYIDEENTEDRHLALIVVNKKEIVPYRVNVEKRAEDTDEEQDAYSKLLQGAKYRITVNQAYGGAETTTWTDVTDTEGLIKGLVFNGFGYITITIEEIEAPDGYQIDITRKYELYRDPITGDIRTINSNVNLSDKIETDEQGNMIIKLIPVDRQLNNKFTLILNKYSALTDKYITESQALFNAQLIRKDEDGNVIYQDKIDNIYTDKNGKAIIDNQDMPDEEGTYTLVITEVEAPEGYEKLVDSIEIPVTFGKDSEDNIIITGVNVDGLQNVKTTKVNKQLIGISIGNEAVGEEILEDEYSLDITKVDGKTGEAIENMAIFKVLLPDENKTSVYTETMETILGPGKLDYCYIEQDKDYQVRLTHMKLPTEETTLKYVFKEIVPPDGYSGIEDEMELAIQFKYDDTTQKMYIASAKSNSQYLRVNTITPCQTDTRLSIDILNDEGLPIVVHYDANDNGEGTQVPADQTKERGTDLQLSNDQPQRKGYIFRGWAKTADATQAQYQPGGIFTEDESTTLYAVWEEEPLYLRSDVYIISNEDNYAEDSNYSEYVDGDTYIFGIIPAIGNKRDEPELLGTDKAKFLENIQTNADHISIIDIDNSELENDDGLIVTEMKLVLTKGNDTIEVTLIVMGDTNSDGILNGADTSNSANNITKGDKSHFTKAQELALDVDLDGIIRGSDLSKIRNVKTNEMQGAEMLRDEIKKLKDYLNGKV